MFAESGFYSYMQSSWANNPTNPKHMLLHRVTKNKVENDIAKQACQRAVLHVFKNENIFSPMYEILIECMANTNNHAGLDHKGKYDWWLFEYCDPVTQTTKVTFLDLGVGIFKSLPVQTYVRSVLSSIGLVNNVDLMPGLLSGEIASRTLLKYRGRGLPLIHDHSKHENIKMFYIISNDVFADLKNARYIKTQTEFGGTLIYFEISQ